VALGPYLPLIWPDNRVIPDTVVSDYESFHLPIRQIVRDEILAGRFPLWTPYLACGLPLHAQQQAAAAYSLQTPLLLAFGANYGIRLSLFLHLVLAFAGTYVLAKAHDVGQGGALVAASAYTQSGYAVCHLMAGHVSLIYQVGLIPWFWLALVWLLRRPGPRAAAGLAAVAAALALTGHPQAPYYTLLFGALWAAGSLMAGSAAAHRARALAWGAAGMAVALLLAAIQVVPSTELIVDGWSESKRGSAAYASEYAMDGVDLARFLSPNLLGNPYTGPPDFEPRHFFHERTGYLGLGAVFLAAYALARRSRQRWELGAAALLGLAVLIALGNHTPAFTLLGKIIPAMTMFRCPGRVMSIASLLAALLAARGLDALAERRSSAGARQWLALAAVLAPPTAFAAFALWTTSPQFRWSQYFVFARDYASWELLTAGVMLLNTTGAILLCRAAGRTWPQAAPALVLTIALADLWCFNGASVYFAQHTVQQPPESLRQEAESIRFADAAQYPSFSSIRMRYSRHVALAVERRWSVMGTCEGGVLPGAVEELFAAVDKDALPALRLAGCQYAARHGVSRWYPVEGALPRVRLVSIGATDSWATRLREGPGSMERAEKQEAVVGTARIANETPQHLSIDAETPQACGLIVADTFYPGWCCTVDGKEAPIESVYGVFRGVRLPAGRHRVEMWYAPTSFWAGLVGTICGVTAFVALVVRGRK
jgi:hypothetical protein